MAKQSPAAMLLDDYQGRSDHGSDADEEFEQKEFGPRPWAHILSYAHNFPSLLKTALLSFLFSLIPSFLRRSESATKAKLHPTAYLDGVRGVAAFFVCIHHFILDWFPALSYGYASGPTYHHFVQLPIIRIVYSGRGMVSTFFIISGYVLSYKALRLMRSAQYSALLDTLASSVFRRGMRLFIPTTFITFISMILARNSMFLQDPQKHNLVPWPAGSTYYDQLKDWWKWTLMMTDPFTHVDGRTVFPMPYGGHLWTIPIEFRGSFVVFLTLLCVAKVSNTTRMILIIGILSYALWQLHWDLFLFLSGTFFADLGLAFAQASDPPTHQPRSSLLDQASTLYHSVTFLPHITRDRKSFLRSIATKVVFIFALYLLCWPDLDADKSPGYISIQEYTPKNYIETDMTQKYWLAVGAFLLIAAVAFSPILQKPFTTAFAQYLGRISYAIYLVHGPILFTVGMRILNHVLEPPPGMEGTGEEGEIKWQPPPLTYASFFAAAVLINGSLAFWAGDWVWRMVDVKAVNFARWVSDKLWIKE